MNTIPSTRTYYNDVLGRIRITEEGGEVIGVEFADRDDSVVVPEQSADSQILDMAYKQIEEYTRGERREFDFPFRLAGTQFQLKVWNALMAIPYGETRTYKEIAEMIGQPKAVRAVGGANNRNKIPIVVPCHRVIGANGSLVGYAAGVELKEKLLGIERNSVIRELMG